MFDHAYMRDAFLAGAPIALAAGLVGYFLVLRAQTFTADTLSHVAVTGALAALVIGIDLRVGLFAACIGEIGRASCRDRVASWTGDWSSDVCSSDLCLTTPTCETLSSPAHPSRSPPASSAISSSSEPRPSQPTHSPTSPSPARSQHS